MGALPRKNTEEEIGEGLKHPCGADGEEIWVHGKRAKPQMNSAFPEGQ
jgi:hypothetical protein